MPGVQAQAQEPTEGSAYRRSVSAIDNVFTPEIVRVEPGQTVEWTMDGRSPHTVQADDGSWDSGNLEPGAEFTHAFGESGVYPFFCRYHGKPGAGMAGTVVVGDSPLPGGGVPGPDPVPSRPGGHGAGSPATLPRSRKAVDQAEPGGLVLIAAGVYREAVVVTTPYLTIRGMDRNDTILEGDFELANGIHVIEADGVAVENLTARHFLLNGFYWSGVLGYRGSYLTASTNGDYGIYAFGSRWGQFDHSYASGSPDAGFYIGACNPCDTVITDVLAEHNALGYSGTNSSGNLAIVNSEWRENLAGIVPNTLDSEPFAPQRRRRDRREPRPSQQLDHGRREGVRVRPLRDGHRRGRRAWEPDRREPRGGSGHVRHRDDPDRRHQLLALGGERGPGQPRAQERPSRSGARRALRRWRLLRGQRLRPASQPARSSSCSRAMASDRSRVVAAAWGRRRTCFSVHRFARRRVPARRLARRSRSRRRTSPTCRTIRPRRRPTPRSREEAVPELYRIRDVARHPPDRGLQISQEVSLMGVPLIASSWWTLLLGLYGYILPFVLYASWVAIAMWDLIRREADSIPHRRDGWRSCSSCRSSGRCCTSRSVGRRSLRSFG